MDDILSNSVFWVTVVIIIIAVFAFAVIRGYVKKLSQGCCGAGGDKQTGKIKVSDRNKAHYPFTVILAVDGMVCGGCEAKVENVLNALDGVWASADANTGKVTVRLKSAPDEQLLRATVNKTVAYTVMNIHRQ